MGERSWQGTKVLRIPLPSTPQASTKATASGEGAKCKTGNGMNVNCSV